MSGFLGMRTRPPQGAEAPQPDGDDNVAPGTTLLTGSGIGAGQCDLKENGQSKVKSFLIPL